MRTTAQSHPSLAIGGLQTGRWSRPSSLTTLVPKVSRICTHAQQTPPVVYTTPHQWCNAPTHKPCGSPTLYLYDAFRVSAVWQRLFNLHHDGESDVTARPVTLLALPHNPPHLHPPHRRVGVDCVLSVVLAQCACDGIDASAVHVSDQRDMGREHCVHEHCYVRPRVRGAVL